MSDTLPVDPDYGFAYDGEDGVLRGRVESARFYLRQKAAPQRIFRLVFHRRPRADWVALENFWRRLATDFFTYHDKESALGAFAGRKFSCVFLGRPRAVPAGFETYDMECLVEEQIGAAMSVYPNFGGDYPSVNIPVASAETIGSDKQFTYAGYGYRVNGTFTQIYLDELLTGGENPKTDVVLGLHRIRIVGGTPTSLDYLI